MKKYILIIFLIIGLWIFGDAAYYRLGWYVDVRPNASSRAVTKTEQDAICILGEDGAWRPLQIRGVTLTAAEPGLYASDFATNGETYLAWFSQIEAMGANTLRVPCIMGAEFYRAFYEYNTTHGGPLYLIQGISIDEYVMDSTYDVFDERFCEEFRRSCLVAVDVIHGTRKLFRQELPSAGHGSFTYDVSPWVLGYVLGSSWEPETVAYANRTYAQTEGYESYRGEYLFTAEGATPVEVMLAYVGDSMLSYEAERYKEQRVFGFYSTVDTDPLVIPVEENENSELTLKTPMDTERILCTDEVLSGQFAAYSISPYSTDRLLAASDEVWASLGVSRKEYALEGGAYNSYAAYLQCLQNYHTMPVLIIEFGASSSRAPAKLEWNTQRGFGGMTEIEQGEAIVASWRDIVATRCAGGILEAWQDDWGRTGTTGGETDPDRSVYWSDVQVATQSQGLLGFDPLFACTLDGDPREWSSKDLAIRTEEGREVYVKYDERYLYLMVKSPGLGLSRDTLYLPIDTTQLSGSNYCLEQDVKFDRAADFLLVIQGRENTRLLVQERYDRYRIRDPHSHYAQNIPDRDSPTFVPWRLPISLIAQEGGEVFETGRLVYGSTDPTNGDYHSLADFMAGTDCLEIRLPWQLLHFSNPSEMEIHGDYYENYGVTSFAIDRLYVGIGNETHNVTGNRIVMGEFRLRGWLEKVTYTQRLKDSYYLVQAEWCSE